MFRHPAPFLKSENVNAPAAGSGLGRSARSAGPWKEQPLQTVYEQRRKIVPAVRADYQNTPTVLESEYYGINVSSSRLAVVQLVTMPEPFFEKIAGMKQGNLILPIEEDVPSGTVVSRFLVPTEMGCGYVNMSLAGLRGNREEVLEQQNAYWRIQQTDQRSRRQIFFGYCSDVGSQDSQ